jgi:hypothetical protein
MNWQFDPGKLLSATAPVRKVRVMHVRVQRRESTGMASVLTAVAAQRLQVHAGGA